MPLSKFAFEAIGTSFEIVTNEQIPNTLKDAILELIEGFDKQFSRFRVDSTVTRISHAPGIYIFSDYAESLFVFYEQLYKLTAGKVTPLIGDSLEALGYDANYSLTKKGEASALSYSNAVRRKGAALEVLEPAMLDYGAAGKGYLVDLIAQLLEKNEVDGYVIDASGDMLHKNMDSEDVGLEDPFNKGRIIGEISLQNQSLCASAVNRRSWGSGLHHIVDPDSGKPVESVVATWVIADTTMVADGLATALFFTDPQILKQSYNYEYVRVFADGKADFSKAFAGALY